MSMFFVSCELLGSGLDEGCWMSLFFSFREKRAISELILENIAKTVYIVG